MSLSRHRSAARGTRRTRARSTSGAAWLVGALVLVLVGAGTSFYWFARKSHVALNDKTLCPLDRPVSALEVVVLDVSDSLTPAQLLDVRSELERRLRSVPKHGMIQVYAVRDKQGGVVEPRFTVCNPGEASDVSSLYANPAFVQRRWTEFHKSLWSQLESEMGQESTSSSAILEAIQAVGLRTFFASEFDSIADRRLVIISDMMQNVPGRLSMYKDIPAFAAFERTDYYTSVRAHLEGVAVDILYLVTTPRQPWPAHADFWSKYFSAQGARIDSLSPVYGAN